jgi:hypothetical protein
LRAEDGDPREARRLHYRRSAALREFVPARDAAHLARAGGPAPTARKATPYLEPPPYAEAIGRRAGSPPMGGSNLPELPP